MPFYLSQWVGSGTKQDPFRPVGSTQENWATIDLRADCTIQQGFNLLYTPSPFSDSRADFLANTPQDVLSNQQINFIRTKLGVTIPQGSTFSEAAGAIMMAGGQPGKWNLLLPTAGQYEVWLGELIWTG